MTRNGIDAVEKRPADGPRDAMINADLGAGHDLSAWVGRHGGFNWGRLSAVGVAVGILAAKSGKVVRGNGGSWADP